MWAFIFWWGGVASSSAHFPIATGPRAGRTRVGRFELDLSCTRGRLAPPSCATCHGHHPVSQISFGDLESTSTPVSVTRKLSSHCR